MKDLLVKATLNEGRIRVFVCTTTNLVEKARVAHDLWPTSCAALGRTLTVGTMMGTMLKNRDEKITIQINGGGPLGTITVDCYHDGHVRGFVGDPHVQMTYNDTGKLAVGTAVGKEGYLRVIRDIRLKDDFTGTVNLVSGEIAEDFAYYFTVSEQIPTALSLGVLVDTDNSVLAAGGILIQMMPSATEEDIAFAETIVSQLKPVSELVAEGKDSYDIITSLAEDVRIIGVQDIGFECHCSHEHFLESLAVLQPEEIQTMIDEDHGCEVVCNYCNSKYQYTEAELKGLLDDKVAHWKH